MTKGLEGIKIVELTSYVAAPACPRILGEMGAEIIRVEPLTGDEQRTQGPGYGMEKTELEDPAYDLSSLNKNWLSVNLKSPEGIAFVYKLIEGADIVITNYRDKALLKLGIDYDTLSKKFPHIIFGHMRGYGERGPEKDSKGYDATAYSSRGGIVMSFPQKGDDPANVPAAFGDYNAAIALTAGVLAALVNRQRTGKGDKVVVNLYHMAVWAMGVAIISRQSGAEYPRSRKEVPCPFNNSYKSKDGIWFLICNGNYNKFFEEMMTAFGLGYLVGDKELDTLEVITANGKAPYVIKLLEDAFLTRTFEEWEVVFRDHEIPYQKCHTIDDILADEECYANDILRPIHYDTYGDRVITTSPIRLKSVGDPVLRKSKPIGYHTREYLLKYGFTEGDVERMDAEGIVKCYKGPALADW
ncbi:Cinnamoyl-CoA:phenyllactate CoA-transferase [Sporomusa silvacetica DSM 10669]|uniref:Cinnamoyl-CoA:phenyllactate CoA-transferase n=1 Tax=Sporomusa silvacetica DSM 10669 TaxID=1123289 RepID=A0ABZ3IIJ1_9FIRM|nr:CaiB/BaiF CoA-transferase family protein [Sporomusa silvacetica]OZC15628.1 E-cinnamoyl-CoA:R-phenyllactate CoA transferase [Sporomusa silvacetica DSM 10669]